MQFDVFEMEGVKLQQTISCSDDVIVCKITPIDGAMPEYFEINCDFGNTKGMMLAESTADGQTFLWGQETDWSNTVFSLWCNKNMEIIELSGSSALADLINIFYRERNYRFHKFTHVWSGSSAGISVFFLFFFLFWIDRVIFAFSKSIPHRP